MTAEKRLKKFEKEFSFYTSHPYFNTIKTLYVNGELKTLPSASKQFKKLKVTKSGNLYKTSANAEKQFISKIKKVTSVKDENQIIINEDNLFNFNIGIHIKECWEIMKGSKSDDFFMHTVKFYTRNGRLSKEYNTLSFEFSKLRRKNLIKKIQISLGLGSELDWIVEEFINLKPGNYVVLNTYRFKKQNNTNEQKRLTQVFKASDSGTCVYDGFLDYFSNINNKMGKSIYNKLVKYEDKYKKAYSLDELKDIAQFCKSTVVIKDLINLKDCVINENNTNRYRLEFINTIYNHLSLYKCTSSNTYEEVEKINYETIKNDSSFYIEKFGKLYTLDNTYKIKKDDFQTTFNDWKEKNNFKNLSIFSDSSAYKFLDSYDFNVHRFINDFPIDDNLYNEIDLKKAYYNYSDKTKNKHYIGVPSGSFITVKAPSDFNIYELDKLTNKKMIGFFQVEITSTNDNLDYLGFSVGSVHTLATHTIMYLAEFCEFKFINLMYAPSVHIPFDDKFLNKTPEEIKYYCKAYGLMMCDSDLAVTSIKPERQDNQFFHTLTANNSIHKFKNIYKIYDQLNNFASWRHIAFFIHSYTTTQIIEQLMNYNIKSDVFGIKLDSIVLKKSVDIKLFSESNFDIKETKIEKLLNNNIEKKIIKTKSTVTDLGLDYGLDVEISNIGDCELETEIIIDNQLYGKYKQSRFSIDFDESFTQSKELITDNVVTIGGPGGSGKTYSLLHTTNINTSNICYTTSCWNLISAQKAIKNEIIGLSLPKLTGNMNGITVDKYKGSNIRYIIVDEKTLVNNKTLKQIIKEYYWCIIFVLGDIDDDGSMYQCTLAKEEYKPWRWGQYIRYDKTYRFDEELNNKLMNLRQYAVNDSYSIYSQVKKLFSNNFKKFEDVRFNEGDVGISCLQNVKDNKCILSDKFIKQGAKPQYVIKNTVLEKNQLRGQILNEKPNHKNYIETLFRTIHSFQGCQLNHNNKIIIYLNSLFDKNLLYTALSRARRVDQIVIIDSLRK